MRIGIVGCGRLGGSLLHALQSKKIELSGICTRGKLAEVLRQSDPAVQFYASPWELVKASDAVFLTVQNANLSAAAMELADFAGRERQTLNGKCIFHCSGATGLSVLAALQKLGAEVGSWHPLQTFADGYGSWQNIYVALDGSEVACRVGEKLAAALGAFTFHVPEAERTRYHAAACLTSNYAVTLLAEAQGLLSTWTKTPQEALKALLPLLEGTVANLKRVQAAEEALTGPIARGDAAIVRAHIQALPPKLKGLYKSLGRRTLQLAVKQGSIDEQQCGALEQILNDVDGENV